MLEKLTSNSKSSCEKYYELNTKPSQLDIGIII